MRWRRAPRLSGAYVKAVRRSDGRTCVLSLEMVTGFLAERPKRPGYVEPAWEMFWPLPDTGADYYFGFDPRRRR